MTDASRSWDAYSPTYRARQMKILAGWIARGVSGSVVGLGGAGKSNVLGFLCYRPEVFQTYLPPGARPVALVPVDLNNMPSNALSTFYRVLLRSFYEVRSRFDPALQQTVSQLYVESRAERDPFLPQSALREVLFEFQSRGIRVALVLDRFDKFCQTATLPMLDTLRGLRDSFKDTLCYIVGTRREIAYLFDPADLGEMYEILDTHVCWVGPMDEPDARQLIAEEMYMADPAPIEAETVRLLDLTGGYPALLKAACHWWLGTSPRPPLAEWQAILQADRSIRSRLEEVWAGLTQEEQLALSEVHRHLTQVETLPVRLVSRATANLERQHGHALARLQAKGLCQRMDSTWCIVGSLLAGFVAESGGRGGGKIWLDERTEEVYQGQVLLESLSPLERLVLHFLIRHPRLRHSKTDLIVSTWPDELRKQGVTDDSLYQVIRELRKKIEPDPAKPCYIVTWRGQPEGGYQFFPEGQPG